MSRPALAVPARHASCRCIDQPRRVWSGVYRGKHKPRYAGGPHHRLYSSTNSRAGRGWGRHRLEKLQLVSLCIYQCNIRSLFSFFIHVRVSWPTFIYRGATVLQGSPMTLADWGRYRRHMSTDKAPNFDPVFHDRLPDFLYILEAAHYAVVMADRVCVAGRSALSPTDTDSKDGISRPCWHNGANAFMYTDMTVPLPFWML